MKLPASIVRLKEALVVSVQADTGTPMEDAGALARVAQAAVSGGAGGIRANGPTHIAAIAAGVDVPIIGLQKRQIGEIRWITPFFEDIEALVAAGADIIALDATLRLRPGGSTPEKYIGEVIDAFGVPVLADVDGLEAGIAAADAGAIAVATTLSGYTSGSRGRDPSPDLQLPDLQLPDLQLIESLARRLSCPVIAEGRFRTRSQVSAAFEAGAYAVVAGKAVSDPTAIVRGLLTRTGNADPADTTPSESSDADHPSAD